MIKQGYSLKVLVPSKIVNQYYYEGVEVVQMPSKQLNKEFYKYNVLYVHLLNIYPFTKENGWPIYEYILKNNHSFVMYVHGNDVQKYGSRMFEFRFNHTEILKWFKRDNITIPRIRRFVLKTKKKNNAAFVFPSNWMKDEMERNLNLSIEQNHFIIPNGIETDFFEYQDTSHFKNEIIAIRSLSKKVYDIEKTIKVMKCLPEEYTLDIYGEGIFRKFYLKLIEQQKIGHRVRIIPKFVEKIEMKSLFSKYGFYLSTTKMDSQGINMMEAMSSGLIVATTDNSSKREFITNYENGILAGSAESIAKLIVEVANNDLLYSKIAQNGRESIEKIDIAKTVFKEIQLLKKVSCKNE
jgi:glycosyltransferase involved in cell wall biosynthesis